jgi:bacterial/archaeal transporter family-2 protein
MVSPGKGANIPMQTLLPILLIGIISGVAVGLQSPLASMITQRLGMLESIFIIHIGGAILIAIPLVFLGGGKLGEWRSLPWYALLAGSMGLVVVGGVSFMIPRVGVATAITLIIAGQLIISSVLDHYGLLGVQPRLIDLQRILGLLIVFLGAWLTVR